jgi:hemerythrin
MKKLAHMEWNRSYSMDYSYIDNQHKKLIDIVNTFYQTVKQEQGNTITYSILNNPVS